MPTVSIRQRTLLLSAIMSWALLATAVQAEEAAPINYDQHVAAIFKRHCLKCHGETEMKGDMNFSSYASIMKGGSAGAVVEAGRASASLLFQAITNADPEARMPPNNDPLPAAEIEIVKKWIDEGLRQSSGSAVAAVRKLGFVPSVALAKLDGPPPIPAELPTVERVKTIRPFPVLALTASPRAPLIAVSGAGCVELKDPASMNSLGTLPFPEGEPHVLSFSHSGAVLLAAGGRPVRSGMAALFDVRTGKRLATIGDELDEILAADISTDERLVAVGGSDRIVKGYSTEDGQLVWKIVKHTDWITSLAFSPDGARLATGDRAGGLHLWDAHNSGILLSLNEHKGAIRGLSWRSDGQVLASCGDDGLIVWWNVTDGWPTLSKSDAHPPARAPGAYGKIPVGVYDVAFGPQGELASCGRDGRVKLWSAEGQEKQAWAPLVDPATNLPMTTAVLTKVAITQDGKRIVAGDSAGTLFTWEAPVPAK